MSAQTKPRYQQLKDQIIQRISTGDLQPNDRVPSENELVEAESVSRMTANRALRELNHEGYVKRIAGRGTFVSDFRSQSHVLEVQNIADEITARGRTHSSQVLRQSRQRARG
jgi:GntR family histidine utilization transcriptional repressor